MKYAGNLYPNKFFIAFENWTRIRVHSGKAVNVTQSDFSRLRGSEWLTDSIINMFLQVSVQEVMPEHTATHRPIYKE